MLTNWDNFEDLPCIGKINQSSSVDMSYGDETLQNVISAIFFCFVVLPRPKHSENANVIKTNIVIFSNISAEEAQQRFTRTGRRTHVQSL